MEDNTHLYYMKKALELAQRGEYTVSPNPMVGCIIVRQGNIISEGWHERAGEAHAEIIAIRKSTPEITKDADMYVTLEPCCHYNRTPPCTDAIIKAKIKRVIIPSLDPNPKVSGRGIEMLREAGIEVITGVLENEALKLNEIFFHYQKTRLPFVILKWAMSLDGKMVTSVHDNKKLSSKESLEHLHLSRAKVDAILVGANTIREDDPLLTCRSDVYSNNNPLRIVLSNDLSLPLSAKVLQDQDKAKTLIVTTNKVSVEQIEKISSKDIEVLVTESDENEQVDIKALLIELGKREITSLLVEGGSKVHASFFKARCVNRVEAYITPYIVADLPKKLALKPFGFQAMGNDIFIKSNV
ncbi:diaminohydroxyphosphoribosylaminopyrimidine deaminase / 5-amino-6-(5-phosphoribosylamino)uracil reductase [endosymbiont of Acanthamoeba sp. UWC8]|uniref:bifunctional diaminohydroxyphosphoribosylaminopyrimidine deaminase/5-amino-6-(5-phosphoribosylamino)uracil reductase RibD n=1 Tax=endosymbiont of Acanthamoeba sp. UWC8 TaxID=86106 RepID=UPI0004D1C604|nr:bifunctional diaminohydroxyphosphoribosylaminopyrimidine deaminase/5-amino-6-(5-phosphoribosylamino)uracil reductase RibD [endosymbiont of Acanthamoeba sp. UWC8]AIF80667.1 diaminohydroxyphosphoribosylaminopyrimidine deaminase / 5-amino-6-(5-phosphoribosylamino)uracil reductase [endosymbiont of Acanthamoeba sp. UWC8]